MDPDDEAVVARARARESRLLHHVGVRQDPRLAAPSTPDLSSRSLGQRDQGVGRLHQHRQLGVVQSGLEVVGVSQVVHREHQGLGLGAQRCHEVRQTLGRGGVEAEVDVHEVELARVLAHPGALEHARRPPLSVRDVGARARVRQPLDTIAALCRQVADIDMS